MTSETKQQFTLRITQANPTELVVILYEMTLCYLDEAEEALKTRDELALHEAIRKTRNCVNELLGSLHLEYEPAPAMRSLYFYSLRELVHADHDRDAAHLEGIRDIMTPLHDAYAQIAPLNKHGSVMNNSQTVYAGLTYGRNSLTESTAGGAPNRGIKA